MFLFVALTSCQKEDLSSLSAQEDSSQSKIEVKELFADDITNHYFLQKNLSGLFPPNLLDSPFPNTFPENQAYSVEIINFNDFIVKGNYAIEIDLESITTYTFKVEDSRGLLESEFANLIMIEEKETEEIFNLFVQYYNWVEYKENNEVGLLYSYHFIMEGGEFYPPLSNSNLHTTSKITCEQLEKWFGVPCSVINHLPAVLLIGSSSKDPEIEDFPDFGPEHGEGEGDREQIPWLEGGNGGRGGIPTHPIDEDPDEENTPCEKLDILKDNPIRKGSLKGLNGLKDENIEYGYQENKKDGMSNLIIGDSISLPINLNLKPFGYMHTHPKGDIFSPSDLRIFIEMLLMHPNNPGDVYGVAVGGSGGRSYMLTFDGTNGGLAGNPLIEGLDALLYEPYYMNMLYEEYMEDAETLEEGFFKLINEKYLKPGNTLEDLGVKLTSFTIDENGNIMDAKQSVIGPDGKVIPEPEDC